MRTFARTMIAAGAMTVTAAVMATSGATTAHAQPIGPKRPLSMKLVVLPAYTTEPIAESVVSGGAKKAADYLNSIAPGRLKVSIDLRSSRRVKLPSRRLCLDDPRSVIAQFPDTPNRRTTIYTVVIPRDEWCRPGTPAGEARMGSGSRASTIMLWSDRTVSMGSFTGAGDDAPGPGGKDLRLNQGLIENNIASTLVHETGHVLGLEHANLLTCRNSGGVAVPLSAKCTSTEYGDPFDLMGSGTSFRGITSSVITTGAPPKLTEAKPGMTLSLSTRNSPSSAPSLAKVPSAFGDVLLEYIPHVGVIARVYQKKTHAMYLAPPTGLLQFGTYNDGSPRLALTPGDSWAVPGGATVRIVSARADSVELTFTDRGETALVADLAAPRIPSREGDVSLDSYLQGETLDAVQALFGGRRTVTIVKEDGVSRVPTNWRPQVNEIGVILRNGRVFGLWSDLGNPFAFSASVPVQIAPTPSPESDPSEQG